MWSSLERISYFTISTLCIVCQIEGDSSFYSLRIKLSSRLNFSARLWFEGTYFEYHYCLLFFWSNCQMCPLNQLFAQTMIAVIERL